MSPGHFNLQVYRTVFIEPKTDAAIDGWASVARFESVSINTPTGEYPCNETVQSGERRLQPGKNEPALLANWFKGISSRKYNHRYADHDGEKIGWARGYYTGTAGHVSSETVENYIQQHKEGDS